MRKLTAALMALALSGSMALADTDAGALPAGRPAGVKQAALAGSGLLLLIAGIVVIGVAVGLAVSDHNGNGTSAATTGTAP